MSSAEERLLAVTLAAMCCWLCRTFCHPRDVGSVAPEIARRHLRSFGRCRRLTLLATILSTAAFAALVALPANVHPDLRNLRLAAASCGTRESPYDPTTCYAMQPGGVWVVVEPRADGTRTVVATVARPQFFRQSPP